MLSIYNTTEVNKIFLKTLDTFGIVKDQSVFSLDVSMHKLGLNWSAKKVHPYLFAQICELSGA